MAALTEETVRQIVKEETKHLATAASVVSLTGNVTSLAGSVANLAGRVDSIDQKLDKLTGMVDRFTKSLETEKEERLSGDHLSERRIERLEQQQSAR